MTLVIDTNAYSAFFRGNRRVIDIMEDADELVLPSIVAGELISGFLQGSRKETNFSEFRSFLEQPGIRFLEMGLDEAEKYGLLVKNMREAANPIPTNDIWIAAAALSLGASLLTGDSHFEKINGLFVVSF
ncbi:MAG: PIN domain-containing protein [Spirochaetaceae bacterium]|nr:PIN domain-containing protein [Spirochaetaceae bacterium]